MPSPCAEKRREHSRAYYARHSDRNLAAQRKSTLKRRYGITPAQFDELLAAQNNSCAICGTKEPRGKGAFHVDHCHTTSRVRGLLCHHCNLGLGNFKDSPESLAAAVQYLAT